jgi:hypothetical protein
MPNNTHIRVALTANTPRGDFNRISTASTANFNCGLLCDGAAMLQTALCPFPLSKNLFCRCYKSGAATTIITTFTRFTYAA